MLRKFVPAMFALFVCVGFAMADEVKGKCKSVDTDKGTITVTVGDKDMTYKVADDTKFTNAEGKEMKNKLKSKALANNPDVVLTVDKDTVKELKIAPK